MAAAILPTALDLRRALEYLGSEVIHQPRRPLLALVLAVAEDYTRYCAAERRPLAAALAGGLRTLAGDEWRDLTGDAALAVVRRALAEVGWLG